MRHVLLDEFLEAAAITRIENVIWVMIAVGLARIRDLCRNELINKCWGYFVEILEPEQNVRMRSATFLELNDMLNVCCTPPKMFASSQIVKQLIELQFENPVNEVWVVVRRSTLGEIGDDLVPMNVASEGDEKVGGTLLVDDTHSLFDLSFAVQE